MGTHQNATQGTPSLTKQGLGVLLTKIRKRADLTRSDVASLMRVDTETIRRWETGKIAPKPHVLESLADKIKATPAELSILTTLSLNSKGRGMFEGNNVPPHLRLFYESEATASRIQSIGLEYLPGLLQTRAYHRTAQDAQLPIDDQRAANLRDLRTRRQEITFSREPLPVMQFLIGRAALLYLDDYPDIREEEVARLLEVDAMPQVDIRVITGFHAAMLGSFTILTPPPELGAAPIAYVEAIDGGRYVEGNVVSEEYGAAFDLVRTTQSATIQEVLG